MKASSPLLPEEEELSLDMAMRRVTSNLAAAARGCDVEDLLNHNNTPSASFVLVVSNKSAFVPVTSSDDGKYSNRTLKVSKTNSCGAYCDRASPVSPTPQHLVNNNIENTRKHPLHESTTTNTSNLVTRLTFGLEVLFHQIHGMDSTKVLEHQQDDNNNITAPSNKSCCFNLIPTDGDDEEIASIEAANKTSSTASLTILNNEVNNNNNNQVQKDASIHSNHHTTYNSDTNRIHHHQRRASLKGSSKDARNNCIASICEEGEIALSITPEQQQSQQPHRKSLTEPCEPMSNLGLDNKEGHLIVHEGDTFKIPNTSFAYVDENKKNELELLSPNAIAGVTEFKVLGLLGKGTFAQVFQCANVETGENLAIKVVKNNPAYTKQAKVEIEIFTHLWKKSSASSNKTNTCCPWVNLECHFLYKQHLCLVFELLGCNLFDVLRDRQFCGLPLTEVKSIVRQSLVGIKRLADLGVVHCDVKPENIVLTQPKSSCRNNTAGTTNAASNKSAPIKIIDFGSAAFEGYTTHSYIQSRFYRSPEVLIGVPYDSAIDVWSLGCVAAELFLGLPILPGKSEHDQLGRIAAMIGPLPEKLVERGSKTSKFFVKTAPLSPSKATDRIFPSKKIAPSDKSAPSTNLSNLRLKTWEEFSLTLPEKQRAEYLQAQNTNRYFKRKKIEDIVMLHGRGSSKKSRGELISLKWFIHLLKGMLDPDPWKRWTAQQVLKHPFFTDDTTITEDQNIFDLNQFTWTPPWDPSICRRQLLFHEKTRNMKTSKIISKQKTIPEAHSCTIASVQKPISPLRRTISQSRTISEQYSDGSVSISSQNQNANMASPPPSTDIASAFDRPIKPHAANVAVHPATFNPVFAYSPGHNMSSTATYSGTNTVHLSPYHYSVAVNNAVNTGHYVNGNYPPLVYAGGNGGSNLPIYNIDGQGSFDGISAHCGSLPLYFAARASFTPQHFNDGNNHYPIQGELGYALTRPGVVPGSSNIDHFSQQQVSLQHGQPYYAFGTSPSAMANASSYNTHGYPSPNVNMLYYNSPTTSPSMQGSTPPRFLKRSESGIAFSGLAYHNASVAMRPPRSQSFSYQADNLPQIEGDHREIDIPSSQNAKYNLPQPRNAPRSSSVTSLLAQQLAEHDNGATQMHMQFQQQPQQQATSSNESSENLEQNLEERIERSRRAASYHAYQTGAPAFYSPGQLPSAPFGTMYQLLDPNYSGGVANSFGQYGSGSTLYYNHHQIVGYNSAGNAGSLGSNYEGSTPSGVASSLNHLAYAPPSPAHYNSDLMPPFIQGQQANSASRKQQRQSQSGMQRR